MPTFSEWLMYLQRETNAPDLWGELRREKVLVVGGSAETENTPFSQEELQAVRRQLDEAKHVVRANPQLAPEQLAAIEAKLDYLADTAARMGRIDWREAFVGAMLGLVVQAIVPPVPIRDVMLYIAHGIGHLFGLGTLPLPAP